MATVLKHLETNCIEELCKHFSLKVKKQGDDLYVLNYTYDFNEVAVECRGLVLQKREGGFAVVCRSFDKIFNAKDPRFLKRAMTYPSDMEYVEKLDGTLIRIYCLGGRWCVSTRSNAFGDNAVASFPASENVSGITYSEMVQGIVGEANFQSFCDGMFDPALTHIFELTSPENRVVIRYATRDLWYLCSRNTATGNYTTVKAIADRFKTPTRVRFGSVDDCLRHLNEVATRPGQGCTIEGYVAYNGEGSPCVKVKAELYLIFHSLFTGTPKDKLKNYIKICLSQLSNHSALGEDTVANMQKIKATMDQHRNSAKSKFLRVSNTQSKRKLHEAVKGEPWAPTAYKAFDGAASSSLWDRASSWDREWALRNDNCEYYIKYVLSTLKTNEIKLW